MGVWKNLYNSMNFWQPSPVENMLYFDDLIEISQFFSNWVYSISKFFNYKQNYKIQVYKRKKNISEFSKIIEI